MQPFEESGPWYLNSEIFLFLRQPHACPALCWPERASAAPSQRTVDFYSIGMKSSESIPRATSSELEFFFFLGGGLAELGRPSIVG